MPHISVSATGCADKRSPVLRDPLLLRPAKWHIVVSVPWVEESLAAAQSLTDMSEELERTVAVFKTGGDVGV